MNYQEKITRFWTESRRDQANPGLEALNLLKLSSLLAHAVREELLSKIPADGLLEIDCLIEASAAVTDLSHSMNVLLVKPNVKRIAGDLLNALQKTQADVAVAQTEATGIVEQKRNLAVKSEELKKIQARIASERKEINELHHLIKRLEEECKPESIEEATKETSSLDSKLLSRLPSITDDLSRFLELHCKLLRRQSEEDILVTNDMSPDAPWMVSAEIHKEPIRVLNDASQRLREALKLVGEAEDCLRAQIKQQQSVTPT